jgi:hypothetical protein
MRCRNLPALPASREQAVGSSQPALLVLVIGDGCPVADLFGIQWDTAIAESERDVIFVDDSGVMNR